MNSPEFLEILNRYRVGAPTVAGANFRGHELRIISGDDPLIFHLMDMPYATPMCLGLARATGLHKVVALEGDGNMLAGLPVLATIGRYQPENLVIVVCDNQSYASLGTTIASATASAVDLEAVARACRMEKTRTVHDPQEANGALAHAFGEPGPWLIVAKVTDSGKMDERFRVPPMDIVEVGHLFQQALRSRLSMEKGAPDE
jgi:hypothetical protein